MSISDVLLFVASNSKTCIPCVEYVTRYRIPAKIVRLDSEEARRSAANGPFFQVTVVPTMVVIYEDGNTQLFTGAPKITQWMKMMISRSETESERGVTSYLPAGGNMYGPRPNPPRPDRFQTEFPEEEYMEEEPKKRPKMFVVEEDEPEEEPEEEPEVQKKARKPKKSSKKKEPLPPPEAPPKPKKKKKPPVNFEETEKEVEVEYIEDEPQPQPQLKQKGKKPPPSRMSNIYATAKQMEIDRQGSLGYREEDLPHY